MSPADHQLSDLNHEGSGEYETNTVAPGVSNRGGDSARILDNTSQFSATPPESPIGSSFPLSHTLQQSVSGMTAAPASSTFPFAGIAGVQQMPDAISEQWIQDRFVYVSNACKSFETDVTQQILGNVGDIETMQTQCKQMRDTTVRLEKLITDLQRKMVAQSGEIEKLRAELSANKDHADAERKSEYEAEQLARERELEVARQAKEEKAKKQSPSLRTGLNKFMRRAPHS